MRTRKRGEHTPGRTAGARAQTQPPEINKSQVAAGAEFGSSKQSPGRAVRTDKERVLRTHTHTHTRTSPRVCVALSLLVFPVRLLRSDLRFELGGAVRQGVRKNRGERHEKGRRAPAKYSINARHYSHHVEGRKGRERMRDRASRDDELGARHFFFSCPLPSVCERFDLFLRGS